MFFQKKVGRRIISMAIVIVMLMTLVPVDGIFMVSSYGASPNEGLIGVAESDTADGEISAAQPDDGASQDIDAEAEDTSDGDADDDAFSDGVIPVETPPGQAAASFAADLPDSSLTVQVLMDGQVMPGVEVILKSRNTTWKQSDTTDGDGKVTFLYDSFFNTYPDLFYYVEATEQFTAYSSQIFTFTNENAPLVINLVTGYEVKTLVTVDGVPTAGVKVDLHVQNERFTTVASDQDGYVVFADVPYVQTSWYTYFSVKETDEYFEYLERNSDSFSIPSDTYPVIELVGKHTVSAAVSLSNGKLLPEDVWISLYQDNSASGGDHRYISWAAASDGRVLFEEVPLGENYYFSVNEKRYHFFYYDGKQLGHLFDVTADSPVTGPAIVLDTGHEVSAVVKLDNGQDAPDDLTISLWQWNGETETKIRDLRSENGAVSCDVLPTGTGYFFRYAGNGQDNVYDGREKNHLFSLPLDASAPDIVLPAGNLVTTTVSLNGRPVSGVSVILYLLTEDDSWRSVSEALTGPDGTVSFEFVHSQASNRYFFCIYKSDGYAEYIGCDNGNVFTIPGTIPTVELEVGHNVTATVTIDNVPASGVEVALRKKNGDWADSVVSDANGKVTFYGLTAGVEYYYYVQHANTHMEYLDEHLFRPDQNPLTTISLSSGVSCSTTVTYKGAPVAGQEVTLYRSVMPGFSISTKYSTVVTDSNGVAMFGGLPAASSFYFVLDADYNNDLPYADYDGRIYNEYFRLPGTAPAIELKPANKAAVSVRLETGENFSGTQVTLHYVNDNNREVYTKSYNSSSNNWNGTITYTFENLPEWSRCYYTVGWREGQNAAYDGLKSGKIFAVPGDAQEIVLETGHTVTATVTLNGVPKQGVRVFLMNGGGSALSDAQGRVTFANRATGQGVYFQVESKEGEYAEYDGRLNGLTFNVPSASYPDIKLETGHTVSTLVTYRGVPQANIEVNLWRIVGSTRSYISYAETDSTGRVVMNNIAAGGGYYFEAYDMNNRYPDYDGSRTGKTFTVPGTVPSIELDPNYGVSTNTNNNNSGNGGRSRGGGGGGGGGIGAWVTNAVNTALSPAVDITQAAGVNAVTAARAAGSNVVRFQNPGKIDLAAMQAMVAQAGGAAIKIHADTLIGGAVDVRLYVDPAQAIGQINLSASTASTTANSVKSMFERWFSNKLLVVNLEQAGAFGQSVELAVKLTADLAAGKELVIYSYNSATNSYTRLADQAYRIDGSGYIHFHVPQGGAYIVSDGALNKK